MHRGEAVPRPKQVKKVQSGGSYGAAVKIRRRIEEARSRTSTIRVRRRRRRKIIGVSDGEIRKGIHCLQGTILREISFEVVEARSGEGFVCKICWIKK